MKRKMWMMLILCICLLLAACIPQALADGQSGTTASLKMRIATRTGPSTAYTEPGTFFQNNWRYTNVDVISKAYGNDVWWVQIEFRDSGKLYRAYTGAKRVNVNLSQVPQESILGYGTMNAAGDVGAYYGPGTHYAKMSNPVPWGAEGAVVAAENGYVLLDYYDENMHMQRRAWLHGDLVDVRWQNGAPQESIPENQADIRPGAVFRRADDYSSFCQVMDYQQKGSYSVIHLYITEAGYFGNVHVYMDGSDHGTFTLSNGATGEIWFNTQRIAMDVYMPQANLYGVLVFDKQ